MNVNLGAESYNIAQLHPFSVSPNAPAWLSQAEEILQSALLPRWTPPVDFLERSSSWELSKLVLHWQRLSWNQCQPTETSLKRKGTECMESTKWGQPDSSQFSNPSFLSSKTEKQTKLFISTLFKQMQSKIRESKPIFFPLKTSSITYILKGTYHDILANYQMQN